MDNKPIENIDESELDNVLGQQDTDIDSFVQKLAKVLKIQPKKIKHLAEGGYGYAFDIPANRVMKVTSDHSEYGHAINLRGKNNKHIVNVYDAYEIEEPYEDVYVIITEKLKQDRRDIGNGFDDVIECIDILVNNDDDFPWESIEHFIEEMIDYDPNDYLTSLKKMYNEINHRSKNFFKQLISLLKEAHKHQIRVDAHAGNFGIKSNGNLALLDLGDRSDIEIPQHKRNVLSINEFDGLTVPQIINKGNVKPKEFLTKVAKALKTKIGGHLGSGFYGFVYDLPGNKVLKLTTDVSDYIKSETMIGRKNKHIVDVYNAYALDEPFDGIFAIISEKLDTPHDINIIYEDLRNILSRFVMNSDLLEKKYQIDSFYEFLTNYDKISKEDLEILYSELNKQLDGVSHKEKYLWMIEQLVGLYKEDEELDLGEYLDVHGENLGIKPNGNLALLDLGEGEDNIELLNMDNINKVKIKEEELSEVKDKSYSNMINNPLKFDDISKIKNKAEYRKKAAGILLFAKNSGRFLLLRRSEGDHINEWSIPGGGFEKGETPTQAMVREVSEEITNIENPLKDIKDIIMVFKNDITNEHGEQYYYYNFIGKVNREFTPELNNEHNGFVWCNEYTLPENLHYGLRDLLLKLKILDNK